MAAPDLSPIIIPVTKFAGIDFSKALTRQLLNEALNRFIDFTYEVIMEDDGNAKIKMTPKFAAASLNHLGPMTDLLRQNPNFGFVVQLEKVDN